jgi:four helix bundle protein
MIDKEAESKQAAFKSRTKQFAIRVVRMVDTLPHRPVAWAISKQILRSATSVAANYRAVCRSRSRAEFIARMGVVMEEADETLFWLELIAETGLLSDKLLAPLADEATQLVSVFASAYATARSHQKAAKGA